MLVRYIDQEVEVDIDPFDWDDFELNELVDNVAVGMFNDQLVEIDRDMYEFMNAPENNKEPNEMGDTHEYIQGGLTHDKDKGLTNFLNKLPETDPWTGERNPLLPSEDVRKEKLGKFGKPSSHAARNEEITFTPEDATDMILTFLMDELPITSRYIDQGMVREWIAKTYNI